MVLEQMEQLAMQDGGVTGVMHRLFTSLKPDLQAVQFVEVLKQEMHEMWQG